MSPRARPDAETMVLAEIHRDGRKCYRVVLRHPAGGNQSVLIPADAVETGNWPRVREAVTNVSGGRYAFAAPPGYKTPRQFVEKNAPLAPHLPPGHRGVPFAAPAEAVRMTR